MTESRPNPSPRCSAINARTWIRRRRARATKQTGMSGPRRVKSSRGVSGAGRSAAMTRISSGHRDRQSVNLEDEQRGGSTHDRTSREGARALPAHRTRDTGAGVPGRGPGATAPRQVPGASHRLELGLRRLRAHQGAVERRGGPTDSPSSAPAQRYARKSSACAASPATDGCAKRCRCGRASAW